MNATLNDTSYLQVAAFLSDCFQHLRNGNDFAAIIECDYLAAENSLPALHCSVDYIFLFFGIINSLVETIRGSLMMPNWPKLTSLAQKAHSLNTFSFIYLFFTSNG